MRIFAKAKSVRRRAEASQQGGRALLAMGKISGGAPSARRQAAQALAAITLALALTLSLADSPADAAPPNLIMGTATNPSYTTVEVTGEINAEGEETFWNFQVSRDGGNTWEYTNGTNVGGASTGSSAEQINGTIEGEPLRAGVTYMVRLHAERFANGFEEFNSSNSAEFSTEALPAPTVELGPVTSFTATTAHVTGKIVTNTPGTEPAAANVTWRLQCEPECAGPEGEVTAAEGEASISPTIHGLQSDTSYEVTLVGKNAGDPVTAGPVTFHTEVLPAQTVTIEPVSGQSSTTAHFVGHINPNAQAEGDPGPSEVNWHFECQPKACPLAEEGHTLTAGDSSVEVNADAVGLEPAFGYEVSLVTSNNGGSQITAGPVPFTTQPEGPEAQTIPAFALGGGTAAQIAGRVNPHNQPTTWWLEWGLSDDYGNSTAPLSAGAEGEGIVKAHQIEGLTPGTVYHFHLVAKNATGETEGEDMTFEAPGVAHEPTGSECPNAEFRTGPSASLPECRAYELVSPPDLGGAMPQPVLGTCPDMEQVKLPWNSVAADGASVLWTVTTAQPGDDSSGLTDVYRSRRDPSQWTSAMVSPPGSKLYPGYAGACSLWASADLNHIIWGVRGATIDPSDHDVTDPSEPSAFGYRDVYRGDSDGVFTRISQGSQAPAVATEQVNAVGTSADGQAVAFTSNRALEPGAVSGGGINVYVRRNGVTTLVSKDENDVPINAVLTGYGSSEAGDVVAFGDFENLYLRDHDLTRTVHLHVSGSGVPIKFVSLSADGSRLTFVTAEPMTSDDTDSSADLYQYDDATEAISLLSKPGAGAGTGPVAPVAVSRDGSQAYFVSPERLDGPNGSDGEVNLYLAQAGTLHFVATLAPDDSYSVRLTPDESKLVFQSRARLTGYDNAGHTAIYLYEPANGSLVCVSCRPDGTPPVGDAGLRDGATGWSSGDPMSPANSDEHGEHIFFHSADNIVPGDVNSKYDVYEHDVATGATSLISTGTSQNHSLYLGNGLDGKDVFFFTADTLSPQDRNGDVYKLYDARVDGGLATLPPAEICRGESCRGASSVPAPSPPLSSPHFEGPPDPKPKRCRPKHAKAKCGKRSHKKTNAHGKKSKGNSHKRHANHNGRAGR